LHPSLPGSCCFFALLFFASCIHTHPSRLFLYALWPRQFTRLIHSLQIHAMENALAKLTPEQRQMIMAKAQQEANQQIMQSMMEKMNHACFDKCVGTTVRTHTHTHTRI
jgi:hypothetical protein